MMYDQREDRDWQEVFYRAGLSIGNSNLEFARDFSFLRAPSSRIGFNAPRPSYSVACLTVNACGGRERQARSRHDLGFWAGPSRLSLNLGRERLLVVIRRST